MFGRSHTARFSDKLTTTPGPGSYDVAAPLVGPSSTKSRPTFGVYTSSTNRWAHIEELLKRSNPALGPGLYTPSMDRMSGGINKNIRRETMNAISLPTTTSHRRLTSAHKRHRSDEDEKEGANDDPHMELLTKLNELKEELEAEKTVLQAEINILTHQISEKDNQIQIEQETLANLTQLHQQQQNEINSFSTSKSTSEAQIQALTTQLHQLTSERESLTSQLHNAHFRYDEIGADLTKQQFLYLELEEKYKAKTEESANFKLELASANQEKETLWDQLESERKKTNSLQEELSVAQENIINLNQANQQIQVSLQVNQTTITELSQQLSKSQNQHQATLQFNSDLQVQVASFQATIEEISQSSNRQIDQLQEQIDTFEQETSTLKSNLSDMYKLHEEVSDSMVQLQSSLADHLLTIEELNAFLSNEKELHSLTAQQFEAERRHTADIEHKLSYLQTHFDELTYTQAESHKEIEEKDVHINNLNEQVVHFETEYSQLRKEYTILYSRHNDLEQEAREREQEIRQLRDELREEEENLLVAQSTNAQEIQKMTTDLYNKSNEFEVLQVLMKENEDENQEQIKHLESISSQLRDQLQSIQGVLISKEESISKLITEKENVILSATEMRSVFDENVTKLNVQLEAEFNAKSEAEKELSQLRVVNEQISTQLIHAGRQMEDQSASIYSLSTQLNTLTAKYSDLNAEYTDAKSIMENKESVYRKDLESSTSRINCLQRQLHDLQESLSLLQRSHSDSLASLYHQIKQNQEESASIILANQEKYRDEITQINNNNLEKLNLLLAALDEKKAQSSLLMEQLQTANLSELKLRSQIVQLENQAEEIQTTIINKEKSIETQVTALLNQQMTPIIAEKEALSRQYQLAEDGRVCALAELAAVRKENQSLSLKATRLTLLQESSIEAIRQRKTLEVEVECIKSEKQSLLVQYQKAIGELNELTDTTTSLAGHHNPHQRIHLHAILKEENCKVKEENANLRKEISKLKREKKLSTLAGEGNILSNSSTANSSSSTISNDEKENKLSSLLSDDVKMSPKKSTERRVVGNKRSALTSKN